MMASSKITLFYIRLKNDKKKEYQYFSQRELQNKSREIAFRPFSNINENLNNEYESKKLTPRNSKTRQISKREVIQRISQNILNERDNNRINNFLTNTLSSQEQTNIANETVVSNNGDSFSQVQNNK